MTSTLLGLQDCRVWRAAGVAGSVEIVEAAPRVRYFPLRVEHTFGVCLKFGAPNIAFSDGERLELPADAIILRPPGCAWSAPPNSAGFVALDLPVAEFPEDARFDRMRWIEPAALPEFATSIERLRTSSGEAQAEVVAELVRIMLERGFVESALGREVGPPNVLREARDYLHANLERNVSLAELAAQIGANRFGLVRRFTSSIGIPPHAYQMQLRLQAGRDLLAAGVPLSEAAATAGFADQSHFGRRFKQILGVPPAAYRARLQNPMSRGTVLTPSRRTASV